MEREREREREREYVCACKKHKIIQISFVIFNESSLKSVSLNFLIFLQFFNIFCWLISVKVFTGHFRWMLSKPPMTSLFVGYSRNDVTDHFLSPIFTFFKRFRCLFHANDKFFIAILEVRAGVGNSFGFAGHIKRQVRYLMASTCTCKQILKLFLWQSRHFLDV